MDLAQFRQSLDQANPPPELPSALAGLWWDGKGDWDKAHDCAQKQEDAAGNWVHAYLHRKEGDIGNAAYWYRRANRPVPQVALDQEWEAIVAALLTATP